mgnify:CR=1 FL=1
MEKNIIAHRHYFYPGANNIRIDGVSDSYRKLASTGYRWCFCSKKKEHETFVNKSTKVEYSYGKHDLPPFNLGDKVEL